MFAKFEPTTIGVEIMGIWGRFHFSWLGISPHFSAGAIARTVTEAVKEGIKAGKMPIFEIKFQNIGGITPERN